MTKIKVIHFADFHLGVDTHGPADPETGLNGRILDFLDSLDALIDYARDYKADIVLFAGDAFHRHSPDPTLLREFGERMVRLAEYCPVVLLVGNHDIPNSLEKASAVDVFSTLKVPNVYVGWDYDVLKIVTASGLIQVVTVPYPIKSQFLEPKEMHLQNSKELLRERLAQMINALSKNVDTDYPAILLGHFGVNTAVYGSEKMMFIYEGAEVNIETMVQDAWQYVALGHLHYHQCLNDEVIPIVYAGSLDRVDFSEEHDPKGFVWVEIDTDGASWEFVEVDARPFVTMEIDVTEAKNQTAKILSKIEKRNLKGAIVRLFITVVEGREEAIGRERISKAIMEAGAYWIHSITYKVQREARLPEEIGENLTAMSHQEQLEVYFDSVGIEGKKKKNLMDLAMEIMKEVDSETKV